MNGPNLSAAIASSSLIVVGVGLASAKTITPSPTPTQRAPPAPALVAPATGASLVQPIALDWNSVSAAGGPIGSYTWQVSTSSSFASVIASGFTDMDTDPTVPTRTDASLSGLAN